MSSKHICGGFPWRRADTVRTVDRRATDSANNPRVAVLNPADEVTAETFRAWLDRRQAGEPVDPGVSAAETLAGFGSSES